MTELFLGRLTHMFTLRDRASRTNESRNTTKVQFGEPVSLIGVIYRIMGKRLYRNRNDAQTAASPVPTPA